MLDLKNALTKSFSTNDSINFFAKEFGFKILKIENKRKAIKKNDLREIIKTKSNEFFYVLNKLPVLSVAETIFLKHLIKIIQENNKKIELNELINEFSEINQIELDEIQKNYFIDYLYSLTSGLNVFYFLLQDNELEELSVLGKNKNIRVYHKAFGWMKSNICFIENNAITELINRLALNSNKSISYSKPLLNTILKDGSRLNAGIKPVSIEDSTFTIRRFSFQKFSPINLIKNKTFNSELMALLFFSLNSSASILVAGNTGSGKTTSLNSLFSFLPEEERIIVIEDTPEIFLPQKHVLKFKEAKEMKIEMHELVFNSLRTRPDRLILGEIRNELQARALINAMLSGQGKSAYATIHALNSFDCVNRLKALKIREHELSAIDLILIQKRIPRINLKRKTKTEERKIIEVTELIPDKKGKIKLNILYSFDFRKRRLKKINESIKVKEKIMQAFSFNEKEFKSALNKQKKLFEKMKNKEFSLKEFHLFLKKKGMI